MFVHTVLFWFKDGTPKSAQAELVKDCHDSLEKIPTVRALWAGVPVGTPRDVVDNSYDAGLTVLFNDRSGHDAYQEHPLHTAFLGRHARHWQRVQVYDFKGEGP